MTIHSLIGTFRRAGAAATEGLSVFKRYPEILIYPYIAGLFIAITGPLVSGAAYEIWHKINQPDIVNQINSVPEPLRIHLGFVTFSFFYIILITAYFTCATAGATLAKLENGSTIPLYGIRAVLKHFTRVSRFAILAIFFLPLGIIAQRKKLPRDTVWVLGSSWFLSMGSLAPMILNGKKGVMATIRESVEVMGPAWHEGLILKFGTWILALGLILIGGWLPRTTEYYNFGGETSKSVMILISILLISTAFVATKVLGAIFTAVLYYRVTNNNKILD